MKKRISKKMSKNKKYAQTMAKGLDSGIWCRKQFQAHGPKGQRPMGIQSQYGGSSKETRVMATKSMLGPNLLGP